MLTMSCFLVLFVAAEALHSPRMHLRRGRKMVATRAEETGEQTPKEAATPKTPSPSDAAAVAQSALGSIQRNVEKGMAENDVTQLSLVAGQLSLMACVLFGGVPVVGGVLELVAGPGFVVGGAALLGFGAYEIGLDNMTPFASPAEKGDLKTSGAFALSRHPMYAGLLLGSLGLSVTTHSFQRIVASVLLFFLLDSKAQLEEEKLAEKFAAYAAYASTVPKFLPDFDTFKSAVTDIGNQKSTKDDLDM